MTEIGGNIVKAVVSAARKITGRELAPEASAEKATKKTRAKKTAAQKTRPRKHRRRRSRPTRQPRRPSGTGRAEAVIRSLPAAGSRSTWSTRIVPRTRVASANGQPTRVLLGEGVNETGYLTARLSLSTNTSSPLSSLTAQRRAGPTIRVPAISTGCTRSIKMAQRARGRAHSRARVRACGRAWVRARGREASGINTLRAGSGRQFWLRSSLANSPSSRATPYCSTSAKVVLSMPGAPLLARTLAHARHRTLRGRPCPAARETVDSGRPWPPGIARAATL